MKKSVLYMQSDIFGGETPVVVPTRSPYARFRMHNFYRKAVEKGKNCSTCDHAFVRYYHDKTYRKCNLVGTSYTSNSDVSRNMVCNQYTPWKELANGSKDEGAHDYVAQEGASKLAVRAHQCRASGKVKESRPRAIAA